MKVNCRIAAFVLLTWPGISGSAGIMASSSESANNQMISYNVVWDSPSTNAMGSMPLGNGDIALNVWAEEGGDLWCYIAKADAWDGGNNLIKAGCVRFSLNPNPFSKGRPFRQELKLAQGEIVIQAGQGDSAVTMRIWVDANHPVIHLESESKTLFSMRASVEMPWRTGDVFLPAEKNRVAWYHRNTNSSWSAWMKQQGLESLIPKLSDPLLNRTFGALMKGKGMVNDGNQALKSNKPQSSYAIALYPFTRQTASVE
ncbi:MAG: DUF5703 domain-containing protein, partial [Kiritimatiellia bacterium]|nr:DUF5703 domain-containing protein [Kiritimatiellia bacterium]